jgi:hypothetical protein
MDALSKYPGDMEVCIAEQDGGSFPYDLDAVWEQTRTTGILLPTPIVRQVVVVGSGSEGL